MNTSVRRSSNFALDQFVKSIMKALARQQPKPDALRVIFILNTLMMILSFGLYSVFTTQDLQVGNILPIWMVYTGIANIASFFPLVYFLANRKL